MSLQRSTAERKLWAQYDALQLGSGWDEKDITKPQILIEDIFGDSHPGSVHLNQLTEQAKYGVFENGGFPAHFHATDICDGCAQGHDGMNYILASREGVIPRPVRKGILKRYTSLAISAMQGAGYE